jgi:hypothetical protein
MIKVILLILVASVVRAQYQDVYDVMYENEVESAARPPVPDKPPSTTMRTTSTSVSTTTTVTSTTSKVTSARMDLPSRDPFAGHDWSEWMDEEEDAEDDWKESIYAASSLENPWVMATVALAVSLLSVLVVCASLNWCLCCCLVRSRRKAGKAKKEMARSQSHREWEMGQLLAMGTARKDTHLRTRSEPYRPAMTLRRLCDEEGLLPRAPALGYHPDVPPLHKAGPKVTVVRTADEAVKMLKTFSGAKPKFPPPSAPEEGAAPQGEKEEDKQSVAGALAPVQV